MQQHHQIFSEESIICFKEGKGVRATPYCDCNSYLDQTSRYTEDRKNTTGLTEPFCIDFSRVRLSKVFIELEILIFYKI